MYHHNKNITVVCDCQDLCLKSIPRGAGVARPEPKKIGVFNYLNYNNEQYDVER